ncbi:MAG TPA: hypothetical protein VM681_11175 [Candidatus Thermoplasmatota archaeon]|nr:hypothetical protein [Candidatus Thermoplasmatota archaeon]
MLRVAVLVLAAGVSGLPVLVETPADAPSLQDDPWFQQWAAERSGVQTAPVGETFEFHCKAYSPCAALRFVAPEGARGYRMTLGSQLAGGYGARATGLSDVAPQAEHMLDQGGWSLGGYGFGRGGPQEFTWNLREDMGSAREWTFTFSPLSGEEGGLIRVLLEWLPSSTDASGS